MYSFSLPLCFLDPYTLPHQIPLTMLLSLAGHLVLSETLIRHLVYTNRFLKFDPIQNVMSIFGPCQIVLDRTKYEGTFGMDHMSANTLKGGNNLFFIVSLVRNRYFKMHGKWKKSSKTTFKLCVLALSSPALIPPPHFTKVIFLKHRFLQVTLPS